MSCEALGSMTSTPKKASTKTEKTRECSRYETAHDMKGTRHLGWIGIL